MREACNHDRHALDGRSDAVVPRHHPVHAQVETENGEAQQQVGTQRKEQPRVNAAARREHADGRSQAQRPGFPVCGEVHQGEREKETNSGFLAQQRHEEQQAHAETAPPARGRQSVVEQEREQQEQAHHEVEAARGDPEHRLGQRRMEAINEPANQRRRGADARG